MFWNCHSFFSFKYGAIPVKDLVDAAFAKGIQRLGLTDINNTSGIIDFIRYCREKNIAPIAGIDFRNGAAPCYTGVALNNEGYYELNKWLSHQLNTGEKYKPQAPEFENAIIIYPYGAIEPEQLRNNEYIGIKITDLPKFTYHGPGRLQNKFIIQHPVTFRNKNDFNTHRLLRAIDNNTLLSKLPVSEQGNETELLLSEADLEFNFGHFAELISNTKKIFNQCEIDIKFKEFKNKKVFSYTAAQDQDLLRTLSYQGLYERYKNPDQEKKQRLEKELSLISKMDFSSYFLINWDIIQYARHKNYFYVGRGSGANSMVAYCLRITDVDPIDLDLYFERFMNEYRVNPPDFDLDFSWKDRDDIIDYIFKKHSLKNTSLLATYNTFQYRAVIRELGKVFGLPKHEIDALIESRKTPDTPDSITKLIYKYSTAIHDFPSHLSIHAGGVLISDKPIHYYTATSMPPKGFPVSQFSMLEAEDIGLYKFDILSQRGLGHIKDSVSIIKENRNVNIDIHDIEKFKKDEKIKANLRVGKTMGCFYVESPAMRMLLKKLGAENYPDLVAASSIIRPGVAQSGMMQQYIARFKDPSKRVYIHPTMETLMKETYGIMVYQEDVIKVAHYFAGMSLGEADVLRRGMSGKFRGRDEFEKAKDKFIEGCRKQGYADDITFEVWRQVESFAGYSFSKGHSASYAVESYQSMFLKAYFPLEFMVGVINNFGGFYRTENYIHEARMCGAKIHPPCINTSKYLTSIRGVDIYLGFIHLSELEESIAEIIVDNREMDGDFKSLENFTKRVNISADQLSILIRIGAFRFTGKSKKELLWEMYTLLHEGKKTQPEKGLFDVPVKKYSLPKLDSNLLEDAFDEIEILGFPLCSPFELIDKIPDRTVRASEMMNYTNMKIKIVGYYVCQKNTRTKKGDEMGFGTFTDLDGNFFDTTHFPDSLKKFPFLGKGCYLIQGKVAVEFDYPSIEVESMEKIPFKPDPYSAPSALPDYRKKKTTT